MPIEPEKKKRLSMQKINSGNTKAKCQQRHDTFLTGDEVLLKVSNLLHLTTKHKLLSLT